MRRLLPVLISALLGPQLAAAAPAAPDSLEWRGVGRASALRWLAPGGDAVAGYEIRGSERPIDEPGFESASELAFFPTGTPRPPGILEFRELEEVEVDEDEDARTVLETALYFAVRGVDEGGAPGAVATASGFEVRRLRAKTDGSGLTTLRLKGRFAIGRSRLDVTSGDVRIRLVQNDVTVLDETIPASAFPPGGKPVRVRNPAGPIRLFEVQTGRFAVLLVKTAKLELALAPGDVTVRVDLGDRPVEAGAILREEGRKLVHP